uniref:Uncharacterized protein n=1 Tax=Anopheles epiroticus TaxID=199890 RepID=A0A182PWW6_9DIPT
MALFRIVPVKVYGPTVTISTFAFLDKGSSMTQTWRGMTSLNLPQQTFRMREGRWDHLKQLPLPEYREVQPMILIVLDNLRLAVPLKTREGLSARWPRRCVWDEESSSIRQALRQFYELELLGTVSSEATDPDERRALSILKSTTVRIGNRFESGLLWKADNV